MSPQVNLRISPELHARVLAVATKQGKTVTAFIKEVLAGYLDKDSTETRLSILEKKVSELEKRINKK